MKVNFRMLWPTLGFMLYGVFAIIAFESVGWKASVGGIRTVLGDINGDSSAYGLIVSGIVFSWLGLIIPLIGFLFGNMVKFNYALGGISLFIAILSGALMFAGIGVYTNNIGTKWLDGGTLAGLIILVVAGFIFAITTTGWGYFKTAKKAEKRKKKQK